VAIYRLLQKSAFGPEDIKRLSLAYEDVLLALDLKDRTDPATELIAKKIIEIARTGVRDPKQICNAVVVDFQVRGLRDAAGKCVDAARKSSDPKAQTELLETAARWLDQADDNSASPVASTDDPGEGHGR